MTDYMRENTDLSPIAAVPEDGALLADQRNWIVMPKSIKIKMRDWRQWVKAESEGDFKTSMQFHTRYVKAWSYPGDPADFEAWDELDLKDFSMINTAVSEIITEDLKRKN